jgi:hypothetical protein
LLVKIKFITFGIMGNIKWDKVEPLEFWKNEKGKELVKLVFKVEKKRVLYIMKLQKKISKNF